jgi:hypothetical protein
MASGLDIGFPGVGKIRSWESFQKEDPHDAGAVNLFCYQAKKLLAAYR